MKDVRERYAGVADEEDFDNDLELRRTSKAMDLSKSQEEVDDLASSMYEFLYGGENGNVDGVL